MATVATAAIDFVARSQRFTSEVQRVTRAQKKLQKDVSDTKKELDGFNKAAQNVTVGLKALVGISVGYAGFKAIQKFTQTFREASEEARKFETAMTQAFTLLDATVPEMDNLTSAVEQLSFAIPRSASDLGFGLYQAISSGAVEASEALLVLNASAALAAAGLLDTRAAVTAVTGVINAYGSSMHSAVDVTDTLFTTVRLGVTTVPELASALGFVVTTAAQAGLAFDEVGAAIAALTKAGINTRQAVQGLNSLLLSAIDPNEAALATEYWNLSSLRAEGFTGWLQRIREETQGNVEELNRLTGGLLKFRTALVLTGAGAENYANILGDMDEKAGATNTALGQVNETVEAQEQLIKNRLNEAWRGFVQWLQRAGIAAGSAALSISDAIRGTRALSAETQATIREISSIPLQLSLDEVNQEIERALGLYREYNLSIKFLEGIQRTNREASQSGIYTTGFGVSGSSAGLTDELIQQNAIYAAIVAKLEALQKIRKSILETGPTPPSSRIDEDALRAFETALRRVRAEITKLNDETEGVNAVERLRRNLLDAARAAGLLDESVSATLAELAKAEENVLQHRALEDYYDALDEILEQTVQLDAEARGFSGLDSIIDEFLRAGAAAGISAKEMDSAVAGYIDAKNRIEDATAREDFLEEYNRALDSVTDKIKALKVEAAGLDSTQLLVNDLREAAEAANVSASSIEGVIQELEELVVVTDNAETYSKALESVTNKIKTLQAETSGLDATQVLVDDLRKAAEAAGVSSSEIEGVISELERLQAAANRIDLLSSAVGQLANTAARAFADIVTGTRSLQDAFQNLLRTAIQLVARIAILRALGDFGLASAGIPVASFATGGYAGVGGAIVGERGPEYVDFAKPGRVYTTRELREALGGGSPGVASSSGGVTFQINGVRDSFDVRRAIREHIPELAVAVARYASRNNTLARNLLG